MHFTPTFRMGGVRAQTDYSYKMSTDIHDDNKGWTSAANMDWGVERYAGDYVTFEAGKVMYQTIEGLPAGTYTVKFYAFARVARNVTLPNTDNQSTIAQGYAQAGSNTAVTQALTIPTEYTPGHAGFSDYDMVTLTVTLAEGESLEYGIQNAVDGGQWYGVSAISLVLDATPEAKSFSEGDVVEEEEAEGDHWKIVGSEGVSLVNQVKLNTWSTEADESGMVTPFVQYWKGTNNVLDASTISHYQLGGLPKGLYTVSIFARAFNEGSLTDIATGTIFFTANDDSVDLTSGTHGSYGDSADDYGTFNLVAEVDGAGTLDIGFSILANSNSDWLAWKNLKIVYDGESLPDLEYVTGDMNATVEAAMQAAVDQYNDSKNADDYTAALAAIAAAAESVAQYAEIAVLVAALDDAGKAVWTETTSGIAYTTKTLTTSDDISEDMAVAQMAQTTAGTDWSCVMRYSGNWTGATNTITADGSTVQENYQTTQFSGTNDSPTRILYKTLENMPAGTYNVSFYAEANATKDREFDTTSGDNIAQVFANYTIEDITVNEYTVIGNGASHSWLDTDLYTLQCTVKANGILDFGLQNVGTGGNWYTAMASNLSLVELRSTPEIDEATASATSVYQGQKVTIQFSYIDPTSTYTLTGKDFTTENSIEVSYTGGGAFTFTVPIDATSTLSITIPEGVLAYTDANVQNAEQTIDFIVNEAIIAYGDYLIVDADGDYLGGGLTWGTQAAIIGKPQFIGFEVQGDGTYHLDSHQYNDENSHYMGANLYFDNATPVDWTIVEVEGGYTISGTVEAYDEEGNFTSYKTGYLTSNGFQTVATVEVTPYAWTLVTKDEVVASMADATEEVPVDVTALIAAPELKRHSNTEWYPTWTVTGYDGTDTPTDYSFGGSVDPSSVASCAESYHSENGFNFSQEITLPLAGYYTLSAKGFYRNDGSETLLLPVLYAGDQTSTFPELDTSAGSMAEAYAEFLEGLHQINAILFEAEEDGETVTIGFKGEDTSLWNIFGELELLYYGTEEPVLPEGTVHECEAGEGEYDATADRYLPAHWTIDNGIGAGNFHINTWSYEADPSGMVTPFVEYWVGSGSQLSDATISHTQLTGLTAGYYEVSIFARAFNESSLVDISEGITFNANNVSIDMNKETHATYDHVSAEEYGTYKVYCYVDEDGTLDIDFTLKNVNCDWLAFKNLKVVHLGFSLSDLPRLSAAEGTMNSSIESAQTTALAAYEEEATLDNYNAAYQAVECARVSVAFYAGIAETLEQLEAYLDDSGKAWLEANNAIVAYRNNTLTYQDMYDVYWGAVKQQTTVGTDLTDAMENTGAWTAEQGDGPNAYNTFATETYMDALYANYDSEASEGRVLYFTVTGLSAGSTYTVSFYVAANMANEVDGSSGDGITEAFANDATEEITVGTNSAAQITSVDDMTLVTLTCTVGEDGILTFGLQNVATGGNWFLCAPLSLTIGEEMSVTWEMTYVEWGTLILPFAADIPTATDENEEATLTVYSCPGLESDGTTLTLEKSETIKACTPYILSGTAGTYTFSDVPTNGETTSFSSGLLTGTLVNMSQEDGDFTADSGQYVLQNHEDEGLAFYQITSESIGVTLNAYHCYLTSEVVPTALHLPGMSTGIVAVEGDMIANGAIYDLAGRKVSKAVKKGIYIQNGKKVLVK